MVVLLAKREILIAGQRRHGDDGLSQHLGRNGIGVHSWQILGNQGLCLALVTGARKWKKSPFARSKQVSIRKIHNFEDFSVVKHFLLPRFGTGA